MRAAVAGVALLVVLAGCPGLGLDRDPGPTTPTAATATGTPTAAARPIGLSAAGVTDPWQLREAHARALEGRSYTYEYEMTVGWGGVARGRLEVTYRVSADRSRSLLERQVAGEVPDDMAPSSDLRRYDAGNTSFLRRPGSGEVEVRRSPPGATLSDTYAPDRDFVYLLFSSVDTAVAGTVTRGDRTMYVVAGRAAEASVPRGRARNVSVRAVVSPSGLVVDFRAVYVLHREVRRPGVRNRVRVVHRVAYRGVGETAVERPAWAAAATGTDTPDDDPGGGPVDESAGPGVGQPPVAPSAPGPTSVAGAFEG